MISRNSISALIVVCSVLPIQASMLILDSFNDAGFVATNGQNPPAPSTPIPDNTLINIRGISGSGDIWTLSTDETPGSLSFDYSAFNRGDEERPGGFLVSYWERPEGGGPNVDEFDVSSYSGIMVHVSELSGPAMVRGVFNGAREDRSEWLPVSSSGDIVIPFSSFKAPALSLTDVNLIQIRFETVEEDFTMKIDEISLIPEPSTSLFLCGALSVFWRRRRS